MAKMAVGAVALTCAPHVFFIKFVDAGFDSFLKFIVSLPGGPPNLKPREVFDYRGLKKNLVLYKFFSTRWQ